jgi:hypothetical protein
MAFHVFQRSIQDEAGNVMPAATVTVQDQDTSALVQLYSDRNGATPIGNPIAADGDGFIRFYVAVGRYQITATDGASTRVWEDEQIGVLGGSIHIEQTAAEAAAGVTPVNYHYAPGNIYRYKSGSLLLDATNNWSTAIQAAVNVALVGGLEVIIPVASGWTGYGFYRCNSAITFTHGVSVRCPGDLATLRFYGCDGFVAAAGTAFLKVSNLEFFSLSSGGAGDPKTHQGITVDGVAFNTANYCEFRNLYMRGWAECINLEYTWASIIDNVTTLNCDTSVRMFGQSVENKIDNSFLIANTGTYVVRFVKDGGTIPEGNHINNSTLGNATYGVHCDGQLSLTITNCVIDQIVSIGLLLVNVQAFNIAASWIYAADYGIQWSDLGVQVAQKATVTGCMITTTAANSRPISIGSNNTGIGIIGNSLHCGASGTAHCVFVQVTGTDDITVVGNHFVNAGPNASVFVGEGTFKHSANTGVDTVQYWAVEGFTGTLTGLSDAAPTFTIVPSVYGDYVDLQIPEYIGTSNATSCTITGMPTAYRPTSTQYVSGVAFADNGVPGLGRASIDTAGVITLYNGLTSTTFTASGNKGIFAQHFRYRRF